MSSMLVRHPRETKPPAFMAGGFASRCLFDSRQARQCGFRPKRLKAGSRKVTPERSWGVTTDRYSGPIGRLSQRRANRSVALLATITFFGERQDITDPQLAVLAGRRRNANALSASSRSTTPRVTPTS